MQKGDLRSDAGDERAATGFYQAALKVAAASMPLSGELKPVLERAQTGLARAARLFERHLEHSLARSGFPPERRPRRFQESLEILTGRRHVQLQLQQPSSYFYPDFRSGVTMRPRSSPGQGS